MGRRTHPCEYKGEAFLIRNTVQTIQLHSVVISVVAEKLQTLQSGAGADEEGVVYVLPNKIAMTLGA